MERYSNALGYGIFCGRKCAEAKIAAGIPPKGSKRETKSTEAQADLVLAQAALEAQRKSDENAWSPLAVAGVVGASLLALTIMVVVIRKTKK
jgi:hypothetical protein